MRRQALALAAASTGLWAAGCVQRGRRTAAACPQALPLLVPFSDAAHAPGLAAALPGVQLVFQDRYKDLATVGQAPKWIIDGANPFSPPRWYAALDEAMRRANFDAGILVAGALEGFQDRGTTYALPSSITPAGVRYRPEAFAGAGLPLPSGMDAGQAGQHGGPTASLLDWTVDDFEHACAAIQAAVQAGRLPQFYGPLPPMAGTSAYTAVLPVYPTGELMQSSVPWTADLHDDQLWGGFALGFGGVVAKDGHFTLTDPATLRGLDRLVRIARTYGADLKHAPHTQQEAQAYPAGAAMQFSLYSAQAVEAGWRFARFPRMPARPAIPATMVGRRLGYETGSADLFGGIQPADLPEAAADAVVRFCLWAYGRARSDPAAFDPSVLADAKAQEAFWTAPLRAGGGGAAMADWRNYVFVRDGWPQTSTDPQELVFQALSKATQGEGALPDLLADVQGKLNLDADRYAASLAAAEANAAHTGVQASAGGGASMACAH